MGNMAVPSTSSANPVLLEVFYGLHSKIFLAVKSIGP
jgi:hypothetical protein